MSDTKHSEAPAAKSAAIMALEDKIAEWESDSADARRKLASYEQSVMHATNIIAVTDEVVAELRAAIAKLETT